MRRAMLQSIGGGFDPDYQAILNYATSNAISKPSAPQQIAQNQLVLDLKAFGLWTKFDVLRIFMNDIGKAFGYINWKYPNSNYMTESTDSGSIVFVPNSHIAKNSSVDTLNLRNNYTPSSHAINYLLNDACVGYFNKGFTSNPITDEGVIMGANNGLTQTNPATWLYDANFACRVWINKSGAASQFGNAYRFITSASNTHINIGLISGSARLFKDETQVTSVALTPDGLTTHDILFLKGSSFNRELELLYIGAYLSASDQANLKTAIDNYKSTF